MDHILIALVLALGLGKIAATFFERIHMPPVVGEILAGLVLANLAVVFPQFTIGKELGSSEFLKELAELGIILMLFEVGLESTIAEVAKVGGRAFAVAVAGVAAPFFLTLMAWKFGIVEDRLPSGEHSFAVAVFVGATMTATSVGITARILSEAGQSRSRTGQIILNAAVIDDVLGLLILAAVSSFVASSVVSYGVIGQIVGKALAFFVIALPIGHYLFPWLLNRGARQLMTLGVVACFSYAWLGMLFGLAPIVGAFFAGLLIDDRQDRMRKVIQPIVNFLAPLFFVLIGAQVNLNALADAGWRTAGEIVLLVALAIIGKMACSFVAGPGTDRIAVGLGMAPRGEVGLIFAVTGKQVGVVSDELFGILVIVVLLSTLLPSIALGKWLGRKGAAKAAA